MKSFFIILCVCFCFSSIGFAGGGKYDLSGFSVSTCKSEQRANFNKLVKELNKDPAYLKALVVFETVTQVQYFEVNRDVKCTKASIYKFACKNLSSPLDGLKSNIEFYFNDLETIEEVHEETSTEYYHVQADRKKDERNCRW